MAITDEVTSMLTLSVTESGKELFAEFRNKLVEIASVAAAVEGVKSAIETWEDYDNHLKQMGNRTGETTKQLGEVNKGIMQLGLDGPKSLDELSAAYEKVGQMGRRGAEGTDIVRASMEAATATGRDTSSMADLLAKSMNAFHEPSKNASADMDVFMAASHHAAGGIDEFTSSFQRALPAAKLGNLTLQETAAAFASLTSGGQPGGRAANQLQQIMLSLVAPTAKAQQSMADMGKTAGVDLVGDIKRMQDGTGSLQQVLKDLQATTGGNAAALKDLGFSGRTLIGVQQLLADGSKGYKAALEDERTSLGLTKREFEDQNKTMESSVSRIKNLVQEVVIGVGSRFGPGIADAMHTGVEAIIAFANNPQVKAAGTAIGDAITKGLAGLKTALSAAFRDAAAFLSAHQKDFETFASTLKRLGQEAADAATQSKPLQDAFHALGPLVSAMLTTAGKLAQPLLDIAKALFGVGDSAEKAHPKVNTFKGRVDALGDGLTTLVKGLTDVVQLIGDFATPLEIAGGAFVAFKTAVWATQAAMALWEGISAAYAVAVTAYESATILAIGVTEGWTGAMAALDIVMDANPIGLVIVAIAALAVVVYEMVKHWSDITAAVYNAWEGHKQLIEGLLVGIPIIGQIGVAIMLLKDHWGELSGVVRRVFDDVVAFCTQLPRQIESALGGLINAITKPFRDAWNALTGHSIVPDMIADIIKWFAGLPGRVVGAIAGLAGSVAGVFENMASQAVGVMKGLAGDAASWGASVGANFKNAVGGALDNARGWVTDKAKGLLGSINFNSPNALGWDPHQWGLTAGNDFTGGVVDALQAGVARVQQASSSLMSSLAGGAIGGFVGGTTGAGSSHVNTAGTTPAGGTGGNPGASAGATIAAAGQSIAGAAQSVTTALSGLSVATNTATTSHGKVSTAATSSASVLNILADATKAVNLGIAKTPERLDAFAADVAKGTTAVSAFTTGVAAAADRFFVTLGLANGAATTLAAGLKNVQTVNQEVSQRTQTLQNNLNTATAQLTMDLANHTGNVKADTEAVHKAQTALDQWNWTMQVAKDITDQSTQSLGRMNDQTVAITGSGRGLTAGFDSLGGAAGTTTTALGTLGNQAVNTASAFVEATNKLAAMLTQAQPSGGQQAAQLAMGQGTTTTGASNANNPFANGLDFSSIPTDPAGRNAFIGAQLGTNLTNAQQTYNYDSASGNTAALAQDLQNIKDAQQQVDAWNAAQATATAAYTTPPTGAAQYAAQGTADQTALTNAQNQYAYDMSHGSTTAFAADQAAISTARATLDAYNKTLANAQGYGAPPPTPASVGGGSSGGSQTMPNIGPGSANQNPGVQQSLASLQATLYRVQRQGGVDAAAGNAQALRQDQAMIAAVQQTIAAQASGNFAAANLPLLTLSSFGPLSAGQIAAWTGGGASGGMTSPLGMQTIDLTGNGQIQRAAYGGGSVQIGRDGPVTDIGYGGAPSHTAGGRNPSILRSGRSFGGGGSAGDSSYEMAPGSSASNPLYVTTTANSADVAAIERLAQATRDMAQLLTDIIDNGQFSQNAVQGYGLASMFQRSPTLKLQRPRGR